MAAQPIDIPSIGATKHHDGQRNAGERTGNATRMRAMGKCADSA
ncbi:MAG: hypothetical protein O3C60_18325 [Planctomycetota bacterium]|nr:hypothetical protein [Planctomycetota bacterium]